MKTSRVLRTHGVVAVSLVGAAAWLLLGGDPVSAAAQDAAKPNVIVIVADDLGYAEVNCQQPQDIPTPRIASIGKHGVSLTNGYVSCPVCSPTRAGLLTGRYQQRFGHEFNPGPAAAADATFGLPLSQITLADRLKKAGYATGIVGKWHLGYRPEFFPLKRGFDEFFGFLGGAHSYVDSAADKTNQIYRGEKAIDEPAYLTDAFGREAVTFIEAHKRQPFFLYLTFNSVHAPLQAPQKYLSRFSQASDEKRRTFSAMLSAMDDNVGAVLDKLAQEKLDERTLIIFISDNGGPTPQTSSRNDPLHGTKGTVWEGGIRVPFMVQWKGKLPEGTTYDQPVIALDIVPTVAAAAGAELTPEHPVDGVDLTPYLTGQKGGRPHDALYWRFGPQWAIRQGDFKLLQAREGGVQLFDLAHDVGEQHDLASQQPERAKELKAAWSQWDAQLEAPRWSPAQAVRAAAREKAAGKAKGKAKARLKAKARDAQ